MIGPADVESLSWDGPDLVMVLADGPRTSVRLVGAVLVSHNVLFPEDSGVVVEDVVVVEELPIGRSNNAP